MQSLTALDTTWLLFSAFLVMVMQAGFCLLETGLVRSKNSINVAFKNLSDFTLAGVTYWLIGYAIMYGDSYAGYFGTSDFMYNHDTGNSAWFLYQLMFCGAATTIVGGALAERTRYRAYLILSVCIAGFFYPLAGHWIWGGAAHGESAGWLAKLGFIDFAGGTTVHTLGGCLALAAVLVVGPRIGRFPDSDCGSNDENKKVDIEAQQKSIVQGSDYPLATVGVILLWFGWFGFNGGSSIGYNENIAPIVVNTSLSAAAGGVTLILWFLYRTGKPEIAGVLNGTLAGLVGVTAAPHLYSAADAIIIGVLSAIVTQLATYLLLRRKIDDVINAFPVHGAAGIAGTLMVALFGNQALFPDNNSVLEQLGIQAFGATVVCALSLGGGYLLMRFINAIQPLRVSAEDELMGLNVSEHDASTEILDLLTDMRQQGNEGDFSKPVPEQPYTEAGQVASEYNRVLDRVRLEIQTREEAYKQLKEASHFQYIFENTREGIVELDLQGNPQNANPAAAKILGYDSIEQLVSSLGQYGRNLKTIENDSSDSVSLRESLQQGGSAVDLNLEYIRQNDGETGYAVGSIHRLKETDDHAACILASFTDVSDRMENEQLRFDKETAIAANRAKSQFLANMSHEIRTPLNGVTGMLELLSRSELEDFQKRYIDIAQNSAHSLLSVINDILDFSKIEAGKMELDTIDFQVRDLLADVVDIFASQTASKNIELIGNINPSIPAWLIGDPERLRQVLINLMGNAVKFTDTGYVSLTASCIETASDSVQLKIEIEDTGCGISQDNLDKLFRSFTQADASTTRKYGGTGLGLTISRQLVSLMDGDITVESSIGKGSVFALTVNLPLSDKESTDKDRLPPSVAGTRVLVVDDHPVNLELMQQLLTPFGLKIDCVNSGEKALQLINSADNNDSPYELLLLDYHMPEMDGIELADKVRATANGNALKLIMLTSIDQVRKDDEGMENFDTLLVKPVRASRLFDSISTVLAEKLLPAKRKPKKKAKASAKKATAKKKATRKKVVAKKSTRKKTAKKKANVTSIRASKAQKNNTESATSSYRILVVEDNPVNQIVATEILEQAGYQVDVANDGQEAIERINQGGIDLVLMDCQMPVLDGFEATRKLREQEAENQIAESDRMPVIALTANALKGDRELCLEAGMNDYVTKPMQPATLFKVVSQFIPVPDDDEANEWLDTGT